MTAGLLGAASHCREQSTAEEHLSLQSVHLRVKAAGLRGGRRLDAGNVCQGVRPRFVTN